MEWKIGEIKQIKGEWYQCINPEIYGCSYCDLQNKCVDDIKGKVASCHARYRSDKKCVVFKKLEKVGKPYFNGQYGEVLQEYKYYIPPITPDLRIHIIKLGIVGIEIKQNKEVMEEKKPTYEELLHYYHSTVGLWAIDKNPREVSLDWICDNAFQLGIDKKDSDSENIEKNLREFDLEAAKLGKPVCTRDGRKARIICFDTKGDPCPIIALVEENGIEAAYHYDKNGQNAYNKSELDLMMFPEKKSGWANIVKGGDGCSHMGRGIFQSKEAAEDAIKTFSSKLIDTVKVEWYE